jgi:cytochrome c-type biogenesis protein CcmH
VSTGNGSSADPRYRVPRSALWLALAGAVLAAGIAWAATRGAPGPRTIEEKVQAVGSGLRCVVCQDLSVADSPSDTARAMRAEIERRLRGGETPAQVTDYFVSRYGESILFTPPRHGLALIPWIAPAVALLAGVALLVVSLRRRSREPDVTRVTAAERARIARELAALEEPD